jgi:hypothetical protein
MAWRYSQAGKEIGKPDSEYGLHVEGPLTVEDWKSILQDIVEEMAEQAKREAREGS